MKPELRKVRSADVHIRTVVVNTARNPDLRTRLCQWLTGGVCLFGVAGHLPALAGDAPATEAASPLVECHARGGLPNALGKLKRGEEVRIAYLGGSITAQDGWRPKTLAWFQKQYPKAAVSQINAAIGGTGSDLGVFRLRRDVLEHKPSLLFVEFAVNDGGASVEHIHRCMEGIVRQTWRSDPRTDICFVYTLTSGMLKELQSDKLPRSMAAMEALAEHYAIPTINMGLDVARLEKQGKVIFKGDKPKTEAEKAALEGKILFSPDNVHPYTDSGHQLYLDAVVRGMEKIAMAGKEGPHVMGAPLRPDNWEAAQMVPISKASLSPNWRRLSAETNKLAKNFQKFLPELWAAGTPGDTISFRFRGMVARVYDIIGPDCGQVSIQVDEGPVRIQPLFDPYCTYHRLAAFTAFENTSPGTHVVKIQVHSEAPDKPTILSKRNEKMNDPKRFEGINCYAGALLLVGELAE